MEKQKIFVDGLMWKRPTDLTKSKAPWVKGHCSVKVDAFIAWVLAHKEGDWLNLDLKESQSKGTLYFELNTWGMKIDKASQNAPQTAQEGITSAGTEVPNFEPSTPEQAEEHGKKMEAYEKKTEDQSLEESLEAEYARM